MSVKFRSAVRNASGPLTGLVRDRVRDIRRQLASDSGMSTAEYAVGTIAACGFAAVLYKIVTSGSVSAEMQQLIERALHARF
ncbi:DUF4244 domain-containing protein [Streptomyces winkii]|uniref:DUF4244 domain-containing protein n=1 Tax=Streptomyces winkii TaxID=3051178 RepID=UPI0028D4D20B|nr:DUF4244 domain-containing protein [Streptomyces sp. DSM 40971]